MRLVQVQGSTPLQVPTSLATSLANAVTSGREEAEGWARIHPTGSTERFGRDALASVPPPPGADVQATELAFMHQVKDARTDAGTALAKQYAHDAAWSVWQGVIADIGTAQGPEQAKRAAQLVETAARRTDEIVQEAKKSFNRQRPFQVDPSLDPVVGKPVNNASYPSGHASGAYAAALVLAALVPERADELLGVAAQVAFSRVYGGVHFPSDVVMGAHIAARVASDVMRRDALGAKRTPIAA